eukprot:549174-Amorphochlora_amoeboformis.AAC.2
MDIKVYILIYYVIGYPFVFNLFGQTRVTSGHQWDHINSTGRRHAGNLPKLPTLCIHTSSKSGIHNNPARWPGKRPVAAAAAGGLSALAFVWRYNVHADAAGKPYGARNQLGLGDGMNRDIPTELSSLEESISGVSAGLHNSAAV